MTENQLPYFDANSDNGEKEFDFNRWSELIHSKKLALEGLERLDGKSSREKMVNGISTGLSDLDIHIDGLHKGDLIMVGARPSMGKTAFATSIVNNIAVEQKLPVGYFSMGMSRHGIMLRLLSVRSKVDKDKMNCSFFSNNEWPYLTKESLALSRANIFIDDTVSISIKELSLKAKWLKKIYDIKLLVIDDLQDLFDFIKAGNSPAGLYDVASKLKALAVELDIPVMLLSCVSRNVDERAGTEYFVNIIDLPGEGSVAHPCDVVLFLRRMEYYDPTDDNRGITNVIIAKNRYGTAGWTIIRFQKAYMRFENLNLEI